MNRSKLKCSNFLLKQTGLILLLLTAIILAAPTGSQAQTVEPAPQATPQATPPTTGNKKFIIRGGKGDNTPVSTNVPAPKPNNNQQSKTVSTSKSIIKTNAVLMPGIATRFKCPEPPLQVVLGNQTGIEVVEGVGETNDFFLLPSVAGISTNMFVQFSSGTSEIKLTVNNGKVKNASYDSEINLSVATTELLTRKNQDLEKRLKTVQDNLDLEKTARKTGEEESQAKIAELESQLAPPVEIIKIFRTFRAFQPRDVSANDYRLSMQTPLINTGKNRYSMLVEITNRDKKKPFTFKDVAFEGGEAQIVKGFAELKPGETQTIEFVLEIGEPNVNLKLKLSAEKSVQTVPLTFVQ